MITQRHHSCWALIHLSANPGPNMPIQPPHQGIDRYLKLIWVTWYLPTKVCKSIDNCFFIRMQIWSESCCLRWNTDLFLWSARLSIPMNVYALCWPAIIQVENVNMASLPKPPSSHGGSPPPPSPPCLLSTLWNFKIAATKAFLQSGKKKREGGIKEDLHLRRLKD